MANNENLTHFTSDQSRDEAVTNGRKGGIASGIARREKKEAREVAKAILDELINLKGGGEVSTRYAILKKQVEKALKKGDTTAAMAVIKVAGEMPKDEQQSTPINININTSDKGEAAMDKLKEI